MKVLDNSILDSTQQGPAQPGLRKLNMIHQLGKIFLVATSVIELFIFIYFSCVVLMSPTAVLHRHWNPPSRKRISHEQNRSPRNPPVFTPPSTRGVATANPIICLAASQQFLLTAQLFAWWIR